MNGHCRSGCRRDSPYGISYLGFTAVGNCLGQSFRRGRKGLECLGIIDRRLYCTFRSSGEGTLVLRCASYTWSRGVVSQALDIGVSLSTVYLGRVNDDPAPCESGTSGHAFVRCEGCWAMDSTRDSWCRTLNITPCRVKALMTCLTRGRKPEIDEYTDAMSIEELNNRREGFAPTTPALPGACSHGRRNPLIAVIRTSRATPRREGRGESRRAQLQRQHSAVKTMER